MNGYSGEVSRGDPKATPEYDFVRRRAPRRAESEPKKRPPSGLFFFSHRLFVIRSVHWGVEERNGNVGLRYASGIERSKVS